MEHTWFKCNGKHDRHCIFCDGGLSMCTVCGGIESSLTSECVGHKLSEEILDSVYKEGKDYHHGQWHEPKHCEACGAVRIYDIKKGDYIPCYSNSCRAARDE